MTIPMDDQALEALLKDGAHVDDAGFADRVVGRLPRRRRVQRRDIIVVTSALLAACVGAVAWRSAGDVGLEVMRASWLHGAAAATAVGLGLWGALSAASSEG